MPKKPICLWCNQSEVTNDISPCAKCRDEIAERQEAEGPFLDIEAHINRMRSLTSTEIVLSGGLIEFMDLVAIALRTLKDRT